MSKNLCLRKKDLITKDIFHKSPEELRELDKENNIKF